MNSAMDTVVTEGQVEEIIRKFHEVRGLKYRICRAEYRIIYKLLCQYLVFIMIVLSELII